MNNSRVNDTYFIIFLILCSTLLLSATATAVIQSNLHQNSTYRGLKEHRVIATWEEAQQICHNEGGYLASPINANLLDDMEYFIDAQHRFNTFFIGTRAWKVPGQYVSMEGIALEDMPVYHMLERLDPAQGDCLSMDERTISVVSCSMSLPFMCRFNNTELNNTMSELSNVTKKPGCSTEGYQYAPSTRQCYKYHTEYKDWDKAQEVCAAEGGHLLVINDVNEAETIQELYTPRGVIVYVGLRDRSSGAGYWKSVDGVPVEQLYNVWEQGYKPIPSEEHTYRCGYLRENAKINNVNSDYASSFLCEKQSE